MIKLLILPFFFAASLQLSPQETGKSGAAEKFKQHAQKLLLFARQQNCSENIGILIDMGIPSRRKRYFVVDLQNDSVLVSGLCAHGQGNNVNREEVVFSNTPGSYCTSEGRYKTGAKFEGEYGTGYRLYGLDSTNCNAFKRDIVLHAYAKVSDQENARVVYRSNGCPMVSPGTFKFTETLIDREKKSVLIWIYK